MSEESIRVLLADDHTIVREGIRSLLEAESGIKVVAEAADGAEAVEAAADHEPDVVLMDISMPEQNGIEATRRIKEASPEVQVLALSMHDNEEYIYPVFEAGAAGYVLKQSASTELVSAIEAVHRGHSIMNPQIARRMVEDSTGGEGIPEDDAGPDEDGLTPREIEVLTLVARGLTNREIAGELVISIKTVQAHRANIIEKLDIHDRVGLTKYALRKGLISLEE